jgi:hypothetical protein
MTAPTAPSPAPAASPPPPRPDACARARAHFCELAAASSPGAAEWPTPHDAEAARALGHAETCRPCAQDLASWQSLLCRWRAAEAPQAERWRAANAGLTSRLELARAPGASGTEWRARAAALAVAASALLALGALWLTGGARGSTGLELDWSKLAAEWNRELPRPSWPVEWPEWGGS